MQKQVTWWKGEKMLPFSSERYEQMRDYSLLIRLVSLRDLGPYTCQAYNGQGKAASWTVTVQTMGPVSTSDTGEDREYLQYVISARRPIYIGGNFTGGRRPGISGPYSPIRPLPPVATTTTTTDRSLVPNYLGMRTVSSIRVCVLMIIIPSKLCSVLFLSLCCCH
jgi:hypothetical protein